MVNRCSFNLCYCHVIPYALSLWERFILLIQANFRPPPTRLLALTKIKFRTKIVMHQISKYMSIALMPQIFTLTSPPVGWCGIAAPLASHNAECYPASHFELSHTLQEATFWTSNMIQRCFVLNRSTWQGRLAQQIFLRIIEQQATKESTV